jgi:enterochelin esterase family protein
MPRTLVFLLCIAALAACSNAPTGSEPPVNREPFPTYADFKQTLLAATSLEDAAERDSTVGAIWDSLAAYADFPFAREDSVAFLYRGTASSLAFVGDFNGWNPNTRRATRLTPSDVWLQEEVFPVDARLDYKVVRNGDQWLLDPENPRRQRSGFGDNSELPMPGYTPSPWVERRDDVPRGTLSSAHVISSQAMGYSISYRVYLPAAYDDLDRLPVIYVTDGHEYADDRMGSVVVVLDNLVAAGRIEPVLAVFVDPRVGGQNRRSEQYVNNPDFARFFRDELVPDVDAKWRTVAERDSRAILGTSLGGLNSTFFMVEIPETFGLIAIQSPAFQAGGGTIFARVEAAEIPAPRRIFMSWGTFFDGEEGAERMRGIFQGKGYPLATRVTHEGHSWGQWRALIDDLLETFWGTAP